MFQHHHHGLFLLLFTSLCLPLLGSAQDSDNTSPDKSVHTIVEEMPEYPGGIAALMQYIGENVKYPEKDKKEDREGKVYVQFVIDKDGSVIMVEHAKHMALAEDLPTALMIAEALRVIDAMPNWSPGYQKGKAVKVSYTIPIIFKLRDQKEKRKKKKNK